MNVPAGQEAQEESADGRDDKLGQPYRDEHGVAAAEVEPVATQQAKRKAGIRWLTNDHIARGKVFLDLILVALSRDLPLAVQSPSSESTKGGWQLQEIGPKSPSGRWSS